MKKELMAKLMEKVARKSVEASMDSRCIFIINLSSLKGLKNLRNSFKD